MNRELLVIILVVGLPLYPWLFVIYEKIGKYMVICAEVVILRSTRARRC